MLHSLLADAQPLLDAPTAPRLRWRELAVSGSRLSIPRGTSAAARVAAEAFSGCRLVQGVLSPAQCAALIRAAGPSYRRTAGLYPPSYRNNDRLVVDDTALAAALERRLEPALPRLLIDGEGRRWRRVGLNERFRGCRYRPGQLFSIHRDGAHHRPDGVRSLLTVMLYLDGDGAFDGGATRFFAGRDGARPPCAEVRPEPGSALVFDHALWHEGAEVVRGEKHVLRTDVLYAPLDQTPAVGAPAVGHRGYVWSIAVGPGWLATGGRDRCIGVWRQPAGATASWQPEAMLGGHTASVCALTWTSGLWSASRDGTVRCWPRPLQPGGRVCATRDAAALCLAAAPRGGVYSGWADGMLLEVDAGGVRRELRAHDGWLWGVAALEGGEGSALVSAGQDGWLRVWDAALRPLQALHPAQGGLRAVAARGGSLYSAGEDGSVVSCAFEHGRLRVLHRWRPHDAPVVALAVLEGGAVVSGGEDNRVWLSTPERDPAVLGEHDDFVRAVAVLPDGSVLSGAYDGSLRRWWPASML